MSWQDCIAEIRAAAGDALKLSDREIERMLEALMRQAKRKSGIGLPDSESIRLAATDMAERERITAAIEKRNAQINLLARVGRRDRLTANPDGIESGIRAEIHGTSSDVTGGRFSAEREWKARTEKEYQGPIVLALEKDGLLGAARSAAMEPKWTAELFELSKGADGRPGISGSPEALKIAEIIHPVMTLAKSDLNKAGAWIGDYPGYIARTSHDPDKIRRAGLDPWKDSIRGGLDEKTFDYVGDDPAAREKFLDNVWYALRTGVHLTHEGMQGFKDPAFSGPGNLAERLSHERVLHFKDAAAWLDYHRGFGNGTVLEAVMGSLDHASRMTALMHRWGTNPRAEFAGDLRYFAETYRERDPAVAERLGRVAGSEKGDLWNRFDSLDGTANIPVNRLGARVGSALRVIQSLSKLGNLVLTDLTGIATHAAELRYQGVNALERYWSPIAAMARARGAAGSETREIMDLLVAGHEGMLRDALGRFEINDTLPGTQSKLFNLFYKWSGSRYWNTMGRAGGEFVMARHLGALLDTEHAALPEATSRIMRMFGIEAPEWNLLRQVGDHAEIEGRSFLTPDAAKRIPDAAVIGHLFDIGKADTRLLDAANLRKVAAFKDDLALRLHAYFNDRSEHLFIVPGIATQADLLHGTSPGTLEGEALRMMAQFKAWPAAMLRMAGGRARYGGETPGAAIAGVLELALASTVLGYGVMSAKEMLRFREPRDPSSPKTWLAALSQGGGAGILGDFLFGEYSRFGRNVFETAAGPVASETGGFAIELFNKMKAAADNPGAPTHFAADITGWAVRNAPFVNLFYIRPALEYLFLWRVQEALNPGFLHRMQRNIEQNNHQKFWLAPTSVIESHNPPRTRRAPTQPWSWAP